MQIPGKTFQAGRPARHVQGPWVVHPWHSYKAMLKRVEGSEKSEWKQVEDKTGATDTYIL